MLLCVKKQKIAPGNDSDFYGFYKILIKKCESVSIYCVFRNRADCYLWVVIPVKNGYIQCIATVVVASMFNKIKA